MAIANVDGDLYAFVDTCTHKQSPPSMGSIGDCYDNVMIESFWARMQIELLDRKPWKTRVALANAIFEYPEVFHNHQRRRSALGMRTPTEYEALTQHGPEA